MTDEVDQSLRDRLTGIVDELMQRRAVGGPTTTSIVAGMVLASERESGPWISCAPCAGVMIAHALPGSTVPATLAAGHKVRTASGLPHSGGMTSAQLDAGLRGAYGVDLASIGKSSVDDKLRAGYGVAAFLTYGELPSHFRRWCPDFTGGHAVALAGWSSDRVGLFDPLATTGYGGEWIAWGDLSPALWDSGHLAGKIGGGMRFISASGYQVGSAYYLPIGAGTQWKYLDGSPGGTVSADVDVVALGAADDVGGQWICVVNTTVPYSDGIARDTLVLFSTKPTTVPQPRPEPEPEPPPSGGDYDEGYAAGQRDEWDAWAGGLGVPERP